MAQAGLCYPPTRERPWVRESSVYLACKQLGGHLPSTRKALILVLETQLTPVKSRAHDTAGQLLVIYEARKPRAGGRCSLSQAWDNAYKANLSGFEHSNSLATTRAKRAKAGDRSPLGKASPTHQTRWFAVR